MDVGCVQRLEKKISEISDLHFSDPCLGAATEFHAAEIFHRKKIFKDWSDPEKRIKLIGDLLRILDDETVKKIYVKVDRDHFNTKFSAKKIDELAFMFFCEKAESLMRQERTLEC